MSHSGKTSDPDPEVQPANASAVPRVVGLLMVILAVVGLMQSLAGLRAAPDFEAVLLLGARVSKWQSFMFWMSLTGVVVGLVHLGAGVAAMRLHRRTPLLAYLYAAVSLIQIAVVLTLYYQSIAPMLRPLAKSDLFGGHDMGVLINSALSLGWAALVALLMSLRTSRRACSG